MSLYLCLSLSLSAFQSQQSFCIPGTAASRTGRGSNDSQWLLSFGFPDGVIRIRALRPQLSSWVAIIQISVEEYEITVIRILLSSNKNTLQHGIFLGRGKGAKRKYKKIEKGGQ